MSNHPEFFVKFRKWNEHTHQNLIFKTVRLSRVFDFNDFNEYNFSIPDEKHFQLEHKEVIRGQIYPFLCNKDYQETLKKFAQDAIRRKWVCEKIEKAVTDCTLKKLFDDEFDTDLFPTFCEHYVAYHTPIFCVSDIAVFNDDAAQLMFAHYAKNGSGVALIYKVLKKDCLKQIEYRKKDERKPSSGGSVGDYGIKPRKANLLHKSFSWKYEKEWRYPDYHGSSKEHIPCYSSEKPLNELGLELVAVLHTARFDNVQKEYLEHINKKYYDNMLKIQEIYPDYCKYFFRVRLHEDKDNPKIPEWIVEQKILG